MTAFALLTRYELALFFRRPSGYLILASVMFLNALGVLDVVLAIRNEAVDSPITEAVYQTPFFWLIVLLAAPAITMKSYAHEYASGLWETLTTAPVGSLQIVLAKFCGAWLFLIILWLPFIGYLYLLLPFFDNPALLDPRIVGSSMLGLAMLGALYVAIGCFASSLTGSQMLAVIVALVLGITLFLQSFVATQFPKSAGFASAFFNHTSLFLHLEDFVRGVIDTRHLTFYLSLTGFFLYLNWQVVEMRRWV